MSSELFSNQESEMNMEHTIRNTQHVTQNSKLKTQNSAWGRVLGGAALGAASAVAVGFLGLPLLALLLQVPLARLWSYLGTPLVGDALRLTALSSLASLGLMLAFG